jgi:hypothetical protein
MEEGNSAEEIKKNLSGRRKSRSMWGQRLERKHVLRKK